jgi:plastocyanin
MGGKGVPFAVIVGLGVACVPALADGESTITASAANEFEPPDLTIAAGETVTFANSGGLHNFRFADGPSYPDTPKDETDPVWNGLSRTFTQPGDYAYSCDFHELQGMVGVVRVKAGGSTPTPPPAPPPTPPPPAPSPPGAPPSDPGAPLEVRTLRLAGATFCTRRSRRCRRPGVRVRIDLSRPARVAGRLTRRGRRFGRVDLGTVPAGPRTLRFSRTAAGRRLSPGRYALALRVEDGARRTLRFRVRRR